MTIFTRLRAVYMKIRHQLFSLIADKKLTIKQVDAIATKQDILGVFVVTQAFLNITDNVAFSAVLVIFSLIFCAILWTIAFILKGYEDA